MNFGDLSIWDWKRQKQVLLSRNFRHLGNLMPFMVNTHKKEKGLHREIFASSIEKSAAFNKSGEEEKASSGASKLQVYMT